MDEATMTIGQLAGRLGVNPRTIRYYERIGLIPPPARTASGYRLYGAADEERLRFIKSAQRVGLTLGEIRETLAFRDRDERPCDYVADVIEQRLGEVDQRLRDLRAFKRELAEWLARAARAPSTGASRPFGVGTSTEERRPQTPDPGR